MSPSDIRVVREHRRFKHQETLLRGEHETFEKELSPAT